MLASQRALFEMPRQICYLNSASWSPLPLKTQEAARAAVGRKGTPWTLDAAFAGVQHERARRAAARLVNADPDDIALIPSISYGVATVAIASRVTERAPVWRQSFVVCMVRSSCVVWCRIPLPSRLRNRHESCRSQPCYAI